MERGKHRLDTPWVVFVDTLGMPRMLSLYLNWGLLCVLISVYSMM